MGAWTIFSCLRFNVVRVYEALARILCLVPRNELNCRSMYAFCQGLLNYQGQRHDSLPTIEIIRQYKTRLSYKVIRNAIQIS